MLELLELNVIKTKYQDLITADPILRKGFEKLEDSLTNERPQAVNNCKRIIKHLLAETKQVIAEDMRMDDESPARPDNENEATLPKHMSLRKRLEQYEKAYLCDHDKKKTA